MSEAQQTPGLEAFLASSIHDMKNSISMLIGGLEKALGSDVAPAGHGEMAQMLYETKRINNKLIQLLTLYKAGHQRYPFDPQTQAVGDFLRGIGEQNAALLAAQRIALELAVADDVYWEFDEDLVSGVIGNALNNALRYTRDRVRLHAQADNGWLELRVEDNGQGYPRSLLDAGVEAMRGVDFLGGSTGLGLHFSAVAAKMHRNHGRTGEIRLENGGAWGGGCFVLRLP